MNEERVLKNFMYLVCYNIPYKDVDDISVNDNNLKISFKNKIYFVNFDIKKDKSGGATIEYSFNEKPPLEFSTLVNESISKAYDMINYLTSFP